MEGDVFRLLMNYCSTFYFPMENSCRLHQGKPTAPDSRHSISPIALAVFLHHFARMFQLSWIFVFNFQSVYSTLDACHKGFPFFVSSEGLDAESTTLRLGRGEKIIAGTRGFEPATPRFRLHYLNRWGHIMFHLLYRWG